MSDTTKTTAAGNDTLPAPGHAVAGYGAQAAASEVRKQTDPRAAGAASPRGAQPSRRRCDITDTDRRLAARARELAAVNRIDALHKRYGTGDSVAALTDQWGESAHLLAELAAIIARLDGPVPDEEESR